MSTSPDEAPEVIALRRKLADFLATWRASGRSYGIMEQWRALDEEIAAARAKAAAANEQPA